MSTGDSAVGSIHHTGFTVSDIERSIAFYTRMLSCKLMWRGERRGGYVETLTGYAGVRLKLAQLRASGGSQIIELLEYREPPTMARPIEPRIKGMAHLCFLVDDVRRVYGRLRDAGVVCVSEPVRMGDRDAWTLYIRDPDGIFVQLLQTEVGDG